MTLKKHLLLLAIGFPPAAKSAAYRLREMANQFAALGWDVTALTIADESWEREFGLDYSLLDAVDPRVRIVKIPIARADLETDMRNYGRERAIDPSHGSRSRRSEIRAFSPSRYSEAGFLLWKLLHLTFTPKGRSILSSLVVRRMCSSVW